MVNTSATSLEREGVSLYRQVAGLLRRKLEQGVWKVGDRLPALEVLMDEYGVSRVTMRQAIGLLEQDGLLKRGQGRGTFVTGDAASERWLIVPTEWEALIRHIEGLSGHLVVLEHGNRHPDLSPADGTPAPAYWSTRRVNYAQGTPYSLTNICLDQAIYQDAPDKFLSGAVLPLLTKHLGSRLASAKQVLEVGAADMDAARLLSLPVGTPIVQVTRVVTDIDGRVVYWADVTYPANRLRITTTLFPPSINS